MTHHYTAALEPASGLPDSSRICAEARFAAAIERSLGGPEAVATTDRAWVNASESAASDLDQATALLAALWPRAYDRARRAGFREIRELAGAHFEVRLERPQHAGS